MKLKIKIKKIGRGANLPKVIDKGEWVDLSASEYRSIKAPQAGTLKRTKEDSYRNVSFSTFMVPLGVAMKLPEGLEAVVVPRSSTFKNFGIIQANSFGVIDNSYSGNNDEWKFPAIALRDTVVNVGDRICQFRIQLSQKATMWQKLKWLFSSGIEIVEVASLDNKDRGGFGSTGVRGV